jgi:hypothetical protein
VSKRSWPVYDYDEVAEVNNLNIITTAILALRLFSLQKSEHLLQYIKLINLQAENSLGRKMARKKYLDAEDSENQHHHLSNASKAGHTLLHDNTNIKFGQQQKIPLLNTPNGKNVAPSHKKGNKHNKNSPPRKANSDDSFGAVMSQLSATGLTLREMPGDGNCLFRALADQLEGDSRNHMDHRRAVVDFMKKHRPDFEPFVEDDEPFEKYIQGLAQSGTFAGNDAIVAFARLHNVTVVIHQLDSPAWLIQPSNEASYAPSGREIHIAYHNGDHYNSVRKLGDNSDAPANVKLGLQVIIVL